MRVNCRMLVDEHAEVDTITFGYLTLVQSLMSITVQRRSDHGRGSDDDYSVTEIMVESPTASNWIQPDGTPILYVSKGDIVDITVEVKREEPHFRVQVLR